MSVSLSKGGSISLTTMRPALTKVYVALGWDVRMTSGDAFDLDACALVCGTDAKVLDDQHFVFFNNLRSPDGTVECTGDNRTGDSQGDDEVIRVNLQDLAPVVNRIVFAVSIYDAEARQQTFGQVSNAFIRVVDGTTDAELANYDLSEDASVETAVVFGELFKDESGWTFRAIGQGNVDGLAGIATSYGVNVG